MPTAPALTIATAVAIAIPTKCLTAMIASIPLTIAEINRPTLREVRPKKLTNHVMGVTARPRIQPISERFRSGERSRGPQLGMLKNRLTRAGFTVIVATDGAQGMAAASEQPDLV